MADPQAKEATGVAQSFHPLNLKLADIAILPVR
jgi:hypothetical protein